MFAALAVMGCEAGGTFPCGSGHCDLDTEVCIVGGSDQCGACVPRPAACEPTATCGCLSSADDPIWGDYQCDDEGTCAEAEGGLVVSCAEPRWGCG